MHIDQISTLTESQRAILATLDMDVIMRAAEEDGEVKFSPGDMTEYTVEVVPRNKQVRIGTPHPPTNPTGRVVRYQAYGYAYVITEMGQGGTPRVMEVGNTLPHDVELVGQVFKTAEWTSLVLCVFMWALVDRLER